MKRILSLVLIILILFNIGGYDLLLSAIQNSVVREMEEEVGGDLKNKTISLIEETVNNKVDWVKQNKEFRYKGELYDLVKTKLVKGKSYYYCLNDTKEKHILLLINKLKKEADKTIKKTFSSEFCISEYEFEFDDVNSMIIYVSISDCYFSNIFERLLKPPRKGKMNLNEDIILI